MIIKFKKKFKKNYSYSYISIKNVTTREFNIKQNGN